jgi:PIN domain nuclease of toxin-antitoxin system
LNYLLDTHVLLWFLFSPSELSKSAAKAIRNPENHLLVSAASTWEICIKIGLEKLKLVDTWQSSFEKELALGTLEWLPIRREHCAATTKLPFHHRDPFDRLLVAQAQVEQAGMITADKIIRKYKVPVVW